MPEGKRRDLTQVRLINVKESVCSGRVFRSRFLGEAVWLPCPLGCSGFESDRSCRDRQDEMREQAWHELTQIKRHRGRLFGG